MTNLATLDEKYQVLSEDEMYDVEGGCCVIIGIGVVCVGAVVVAGGCCCLGALGWYCHNKKPC